jgi:hypothetical protein
VEKDQVEMGRLDLAENQEMALHLWQLAVMQLAVLADSLA